MTSAAYTQEFTVISAVIVYVIQDQTINVFFSACLTL